MRLHTYADLATQTSHKHNQQNFGQNFTKISHTWQFSLIITIIYAMEERGACHTMSFQISSDRFLYMDRWRHAIHTGIL